MFILYTYTRESNHVDVFNQIDFLLSPSTVFSGEVDAIDLQAKEPCKYVEFKTTRQLDSYRQERNFIK